MRQTSIFRALAFTGALASASAAQAIDFTLISVGQAPSGVCENNVITDVTDLAVSYNLLDNGGAPNIRFSWVITPSTGPIVNQSVTFAFDPESAVQTDVQDWFDDKFGGSIPVPGNPSTPWTGTITGSPIDAGGNVVGTSARFTLQCNGETASIAGVGSGILVGVASPSTPVPMDSPAALIALALALVAFGARATRRRR